MRSYEVVSDFLPMGDQGKAIETLANGIANQKIKHMVLKGATGTGKTYTLAKTIELVNQIEKRPRPVLILSPNKTLAGQLYQELKEFFPNNAVGFFISYYDYYLPESYIPTKDLYIEKETSVNDEIDRYRNEATRFLIEREDVIIVASVSAIYGLGSPEFYKSLGVLVKNGEEFSRDELLLRLIDIQYTRNETVLNRGNFRAKGDRVELFPPYEWNHVRIDFFDDEIESICIVDPLNKSILEKRDEVFIFPAKHYVTPEDIKNRALITIKKELEERLIFFENIGKIVEAQRLKQRTIFDLEMLRETGFCTGIENYSIHFEERETGVPPSTLIEFFDPERWLCVIDESHVGLPQLRGMYAGDRSRKENLVDYGFRLPCALDNRPLTFEEFMGKVNQIIYMSATPADQELDYAGKEIVEQIIRPTGLLDPEIVVKPTEGQIDDLMEEIQEVLARNERVLITTFTKKMAEALADYFQENGVQARYMHSEIDSLERNKIIHDLRSGEFDVLVGINLLREGLDLPEVSLVGILDADKEGFLRNARSLIQTSGRASRNVSGRVIMYADKITESMRIAIQETNRRRQIQHEFNIKHGIEPKTIIKSIKASGLSREKEKTIKISQEIIEDDIEFEGLIKSLMTDMKTAAEALEFERAAKIRDTIKELQDQRSKT
ncbi:MAG: excinuclease ABC subunit UvrB [Candidatus Hodarchaeales archaeon]|jgi:excinuclease ABC subunit B